MKKMLKALAVSCALAASASMVHATDYVVNITGSTAFRASVYNAIINYINTKSPTTVRAVYNGSSLSGAGVALIKGVTASDTYTFKTDFSGSVTGITSVAANSPAPLSFIDPADPAVVTALASSSSDAFASLSGATGGTAVSGNGTVSEVATTALADVEQAVTQASGPGFADLDGLGLGIQVGVVPFTWVGNHNIPAGVIAAGVHGKTAAGIWTNKYTRVNQFDGSGSLDKIVIVGRDFDSGTRIDALLEACMDPLDFPNINQWTEGAPSSGFYSTIALAANGVGRNDGGASSGGTLATALALSSSATDGVHNIYAIGYLGRSDATTAINAGAIPLAYNGVSYASAPLGVASFDASVIENGQYSFWSIENLYIAPGASPDAATVSTDLATVLSGADAEIAGYQLTDLSVARNGAGQPIFQP